MTRFVIDPTVAQRLTEQRIEIPSHHRLLAPTLLRSQLLSLLYAAVRSGDLDRTAAEGQLDYLRNLRIRLLGDRVLQRAAWKIADEVGWPDCLLAEYIALTRLQADAFITLDPRLSRELTGLVALGSIEELVA